MNSRADNKTAEDIASRAKTPEECLVIVANALARDRQDVARAARRRAVVLRAKGADATSAVEEECWKAFFAYEDALTEKHNRTTKANRLRPLIDRVGIIAAVEDLVTREKSPPGYTTLVEMGLEMFTFEAVIAQHPETFSLDAVRHAKNRLDNFKDAA